MTKSLHIGIDAGSKTLKIVVMNDCEEVLFSLYDRHLSNVKETLIYALQQTLRRYPNLSATIGMTGSAGMKIATEMRIPFSQEVIAGKKAVEHFVPDADVAIELGGEDSKILFLTGGEELRMNSACAGGTGGFIDTIAGMLDINAEKLNALAHGCETIYPIASRCAVFAQSDVRPLLNEGVSKRDIAGSVFRAVAVQCVTGLACGRSIKGKIVFLGGPLHFLSALRKHFCEVLDIPEEETFVPREAHLYVAQGAALSAWTEEEISVESLIEKMKTLDALRDEDIGEMETLFQTEEEYLDFKTRHAKASVQRNRLSAYEGPVYLGIDAGSTSIKCVLIDADKKILYSCYKRSAGDLVEVSRDMLVDLYKHLPRRPDGTQSVYIASSVSTGYGEDFLKNAFLVDSGEVETIVHMRAAQELEPEVDCILDIGGQDIKFIKIRDNMPDEVVLNEACSSGCGSLISGFAWSFNTKLRDFVAQALMANRPVDLGTRCTVFMTSRVRHAQKIGSSLGDISAGLAYSVVKNALYKVIREPDIARIGETVVVQGGTFKNDAVLRAFEKLSKKTVIRPDISEYMGAYGAALLAREREKEGSKSSLLSEERVKKLRSKQSSFRCSLCMNKCLLTANRFGNEDEGYIRSYITGNRCERGIGNREDIKRPPNLFTYRYRRLFGERYLEKSKATKGKIGLLRALNMFDEYPFWATLFTHLGYEVVLSDPSSRNLYARGIETIPSESACYPVKIAHGHTLNLIEKGVDLVFAPHESFTSDRDMRCPVYVNYPTALEANIDDFSIGKKKLLSPYVESLHPANRNQLAETLIESFQRIGIKQPTVSDLLKAIGAGFVEMESFKKDMLSEGEKAFRFMEEHSTSGIVLAGRPYHGDPEINHAIPELLEAYGFTVFTIDSLPGLKMSPTAKNISRWGYVNQTYQAAQLVASHAALEMIQLYSFGCGIDAVSTDSIRAILKQGGKTFAALKIDEMCDIAAARIRIRSMLAASHLRKQQNDPRDLSLCVKKSSAPVVPSKVYVAHWSQEDFDVLASLLSSEKTTFSALDTTESPLIQTALSYENNDSCFASLIAIGQVASALEQGKIEASETAIMAPHPCLFCVSGDMKAQLNKVLALFEKEHIPLYCDLNDLVSYIDERALEDKQLVDRVACGLIVADLMRQAYCRMRPYCERDNGFFDKNKLFAQIKEKHLWEDCAQLEDFLVKNIAASLKRVSNKKRKPKVGITGLFPSVFCDAINDDLIGLLEEEGCEVVIPPMTDYLLYSMMIENKESLFYSRLLAWRDFASRIIMHFDGELEPCFFTFDKRQPLYLDVRDTQGMGWLFSIHAENYQAWGLKTIIYSQVFGCLPGHCLGRGIFKKIKKQCQDINLLSIEFDPGINGVNRENRVKLLAATAKMKERKETHASYV